MRPVLTTTLEKENGSAPYFLTLLLTTSFLFLALFSKAQTSGEAVLYNNSQYGGTARFVSMGSSMGALGGDFGTLSTNPAGIGIYNSSEIMITPTIYNPKSTSTFYGNTNESSLTKFNINNVGAVLVVQMNDNSTDNDIKSIQFGFGINRTNDLNSSSYFYGFNDESSFCSGLAEQANEMGIPLGSIQELAYTTNLLYNPDTNNRNYYVCDLPYGGVDQEIYVETSGYRQEIAFSFGGNYNNRLYFGVTLSIPVLRYTQYFTLYETDTDGLSQEYYGLDYHEKIETRSTGIAGKFGLIYRATNWLRIGAAIHTPTILSNMHDEYYSSMESYFDSPYESLDSYADTPIGIYDYQLSMPFKAIGSVGFIVGPYGSLNAEYEFSDYSQLKYKPNIDFQQTNSEMASLLQVQHTVRIGTEWRVGILRLRAGYAYFSNPYSGDFNDASMQQYSGGFGLKFRNYAIDFAYRRNQTTSNYYPYNADPYGTLGINSPVVKQENSADTYMLTLSARL